MSRASTDSTDLQKYWIRGMRSTILDYEAAGVARWLHPLHLLNILRLVGKRKDIDDYGMGLIAKTWPVSTESSVAVVKNITFKVLSEYLLGERFN